MYYARRDRNSSGARQMLFTRRETSGKLEIIGKLSVDRTHLLSSAASSSRRLSFADGRDKFGVDEPSGLNL